MINKDTETESEISVFAGPLDLFPNPEINISHLICYKSTNLHCVANELLHLRLNAAK